MRNRNRRDFVSGSLKLSASLAMTSMLAKGGIAAAASDVDRPVAGTAEGVLRGTNEGKMNVFKGIRYGEDTGKARFRPAVPVRPWAGVREATALGSPCFQRNLDTSPWVDPQPESEDCLFLNVWAPRDASGLPVMVWIHGGGFWWGSGGCPIYDGAKLAERGEAVVVSVNHRLNLFGYLYLGELSSEFADSANLGQLDLIEALHWIQRNIAAFGGDPDNVTLFGESGGGMKISALLAMPKAKGLLHRAIVQSGSLTKFSSMESATRDARSVLKELGLPESNVEALRTIPASRLVAAYDAILMRQGFGSTDNLPFAPLQHAATLPFQPEEPAARALWKDVPLLVGTTEEETVWLLSVSGGVPQIADDDALERAVIAFKDVGEEKTRALVAAYRESMPDADRQRLLVAITTGFWMGGHAVRQAELKAETGGAPAYMFMYSWKEPFLGDAWALHGGDIVWVFDKLEMANVYEDKQDTAALRAQRDPAGARYRLRDATIAAWSTFARTGKPTTALLPEWPAYSPEGRYVMRLDAAQEIVKDPLGADVRALLAE